MDEEVKRSRAKKKLLKVTFPNGKVICYNNATSTMIAVLNEIGERLVFFNQTGNVPFTSSFKGNISEVPKGYETYL